MAEFQPAPTWAEVVLVDEQTGKFSFNPIWLNWFLALVELINDSGGGGGTFLHNSLGSIQGGSATERYHLGATNATVLSGDPGADRIIFFDDSAGFLAYLTAGTNLSITGTTLNASSSTPDPLLLGDGSSTAPTYSFTSDTDTGIYRIAANTLGLAAGGLIWQILAVGTDSAILAPGPATSSSNGINGTLSAGDGGGTSGNGGSFTINAGSAGGSGNGGAFSLLSGTAVGTNKIGGGFSMTAGNSTGNRTGGAFAIVAGNGGPTGAGGGFQITTGNGGGTSGASGSLTVLTGTSTDGDTGSVTLSTPNATGTNRSGGNVVFKTGNATGGGTNGAVLFQTSGAVSYFKGDSKQQHATYLGTSPTITAGGGTSPSIVGKDQAFTVTIGTGGIATTFTVTFANAFTNAPPAHANSDTDIVALKVATTTTTVVVTATAAFTAGSKVHVIVGSWE